MDDADHPPGKTGPQLPIEVDEQTGVWTTDGLPMLYVPRHFFINNHLAVEAALGQANYAKYLYPAGYKSAYYWCGQESNTHGLEGLAVFEHYLARLSKRGWGLFQFVEASSTTGQACIMLQHSCFVLQNPERQGKLCYMFAGWFAGAMDWVIETTRPGSPVKTTCEETQCASEGAGHCLFTVSAK